MCARAYGVGVRLVPTIWTGMLPQLLLSSLGKQNIIYSFLINCRTATLEHRVRWFALCLRNFRKTVI